MPVHKGTIPHEQEAKFGGSRVILKPASHGTGVKAGGAMRAVLESVGITDVLAKAKAPRTPQPRESYHRRPRRNAFARPEWHRTAASP